MENRATADAEAGALIPVLELASVTETEELLPEESRGRGRCAGLGKRIVVAGVATALVLVAAVAACSQLRQGQLQVLEPVAPEAVVASAEHAVDLWFGSGTSKTTWEVESLKTGCKNWRQISMDYTIQDTLQACGDLCVKTEGCVSFSWQEHPKDMCSHHKGGAKGACSLWKDECHMEFNSCMHLYKITHTSSSMFGLPRSTAWLPEGLMRGCSNWRQVNMGPAVRLATADECGKRCMHTEGCKMFNFQTLPHSDCVPGGAEEGTCQLLKEGCKQQYNSCMDLWYMTSRTSIKYPQELANNVALKAINGALEKQLADMNKKMPEKIHKELKKKPMFVDEANIKVPTVIGMESVQIKTLKASRVRAEVLGGKIKAHLVMTAHPLEPIRVPKATGIAGPIAIDFATQVFGSWFSAVHMEATVEMGPPIAITEMHTHHVDAGYNYAHANCLADFMNVCSNTLQSVVDQSKGDFCKQMGQALHDQMQIDFEESMPMYADPKEGKTYCMIPSRKCLKATEWAKNTGFHRHPDWYPGLTSESTFGEFQDFLYENQQEDTMCVPFCANATKDEDLARAQTKRFG
eukprot:TRINITY_DN23892_c0_g1_i1.p1 TRINITY_DN23892_c0_g1~~TRINITY_DN23892_c0_g1_i1.p1  ORF type:complete len:604 (-),score=94.42 TRINITY_DN23892_c0_g1_i1:606-2336(-)